MKRVRISLQAQADLEEIWSYVAHDSVASADRLLERIYQTCQDLLLAPALGRPRGELAAGLRSFPVGNYLIFYRPVKEDVEVVRVLSGYRDIETLFGL